PRSQNLRVRQRCCRSCERACADLGQFLFGARGMQLAKTQKRGWPRTNLSTALPWSVSLRCRRQVAHCKAARDGLRRLRRTPRRSPKSAGRSVWGGAERVAVPSAVDARAAWGAPRPVRVLVLGLRGVV